MAHYPQLTINRVSANHKLYIYRSTNADDINTIEKIRHLEPIASINEAVATGDKYIFKDSSSVTQPAGITYNGPTPNVVPCVEYESKVRISKVNDYTYMNCFVLKPLPLKYGGIMLYYSIIGVDESANTITHLSKVNGTLVHCEYESEGTRHLYSCDDYKGKPEDVWSYVAAVPWSEEEIKIGDYNDPVTFDRYKCPVVETVTPLDAEKISAQTRMTLTRNFLVMEIQNPWRKNNEEFNFRKLKSFKVCNVVGSSYSRFSEPTYQSLLPVPVEKLLILRKKNPDTPGMAIDIEDADSDGIEKWEIIRRDGIYYNRTEHKRFGLNKWNIPLGETISVFNEASTQDTINIQMPANVSDVYDYTFYVFDTYGKHSEATVKTVEV